MILRTRAFSIVGSAYRLIGYPRVGYGCVGYPLVTYGSVGKGTLSFRGVSDMSYPRDMSDLPYYVPLWDGMSRYRTVHTNTPHLSYLSLLSVLSVPGLYCNGMVTIIRLVLTHG